MNIETKGVSVGVTGVDVSSVQLKIEQTGFKKASDAISEKFQAVNLEKALTKIGQGALELKKKAMTIFS
jgi:sarcosine oxidase gamma subunit